MLCLAALASISNAPAAGVSADLAALIVFALAVLATLAYLGAYRARIGSHFLDEARAILGATALVAMGITFMRVLVFDNPQAADHAVRAWLFAATYMIAARGGLSLLEIRQRRDGTRATPTLIVGAGAVGRQFAARLIERPAFGLRPVAFLDDDPLDVEETGWEAIPVLRSNPRATNGRWLFGGGLERVLEEYGIAHVIVSFSSASHEAELDLVRRCNERGVSVSMLPRLFEGVPDQTDLIRLGGMPLISLHPSDPRGWSYRVKYGADRVLAFLGIVVLAPVMLTAAAATLLSLGRPVIFRQRRIGLDGRDFNLFKFRTMRPPGPGEHPEGELEGKLGYGLAPGGAEGAERRTAVGRFLRETSIDELPQLFNVLRGDMSLVGPRPERPSYATRFEETVYRYADRHRVKSGITGWAQVQGLRGNTSIIDRAEWDNYYIENRSAWLDLKILALTVPAVLRERRTDRI